MTSFSFRSIPDGRPRHSTSFREKVFDVVRGIPRGSVMTYGEVARMTGSPRAHRAVGSILKTNFDPAIPCHRVVKSDGSLGQYNRGVDLKREILLEEGIILDKNGRV